MEPGHTQDEIGFLLETIQPYLAKPVGESDILSVFSGLRPLVTGSAASTSKLSREHHIEASAAWADYRRGREVDDVSPDGRGCGGLRDEDRERWRSGRV